MRKRIRSRGKRKASTRRPNKATTGAPSGGGTTRREFLANVGAAAIVAVTSSSAKAGTAQFPGAVAGSLPTPLYRIHPFLGIARVGNADPSDFFIGAEIPGYPPDAVGDAGSAVPPYKDTSRDPNGLVKPQAARFRIFEYGYVNNRLTPLREVNLGTAGIQSITWTAHIANKKASFYLENNSAGDATAGIYPPLPAAGLRNPSVANRQSLENDFGPRSISGASAGPVTIDPYSGSPVSVVRDASGNPLIDYMGQLRTDAQGRLIFIGGKGKSASSSVPTPSLTHWSNNFGWFDDTGDGPVTATVTLTNGKTYQMNGTDPVSGQPWAGSAWVTATVPRHAPSQQAAVTLYDCLYDVAVRSLPYPKNSALYDDGGPLASLRRLQADFTPGAAREFPTYMPDFATEINPLLLSGYRYIFTTELANFKMQSLLDPSLADPGAASAKNRSGVYVYVRAPLGALASGGPQAMPSLRGDDPYMGQSLAHYMFAQAGPGVVHGASLPTSADYTNPLRSLPLTHVQYGLLGRWSDGFFTNAGTPPEQLSPAITPHGLDRAALENCIGGAFGPGLEVGWQIRHPALFAEPFRLDPNAKSQYLDQNGHPELTPIGPGHFTRQQAVPWQADYNACRTEGQYGWWPSGRVTAVWLSSSDFARGLINARVDWARPDDVFPGNNKQSNYDDMLNNWWKFGFLALSADGTAWVETERAPHVP
jgi:hypothetical protein